MSWCGCARRSAADTAGTGAGADAVQRRRQVGDPAPGGRLQDRPLLRRATTHGNRPTRLPRGERPWRDLNIAQWLWCFWTRCQRTCVCKLLRQLQRIRGKILKNVAAVVLHEEVMHITFSNASFATPRVDALTIGALTSAVHRYVQSADLEWAEH